jgi:GntR family transcriptional regulator
MDEEQERTSRLLLRDQSGGLRGSWQRLDRCRVGQHAALRPRPLAGGRRAPRGRMRVDWGLSGYAALVLPSRFPYQDIVEALRASILEGRFDAGERLPSENELAERYGTSRPTVRRAIALLKAEGLVSTEQGRGAFVRARPHVRLVLSGANFRRHRRAGLSGFNAQVEEQGQVPEQRLLEVTRGAAPDDVAARLGLQPASSVVVRRRLFLVNEEPVALCDSYYPGDWAKGTALAKRERIAGGAYRLIEDPAGPIARKLKRSVDELVSRMPTPREVEVLGLGPGVPVVRILRTVYDSQGAVVEVQETVAAADKHELRYEVAMR